MWFQAQHSKSGEEIACWQVPTPVSLSWSWAVGTGDAGLPVPGWVILAPRPTSAQRSRCPEPSKTTGPAFAGLCTLGEEGEHPRPDSSGKSIKKGHRYKVGRHALPPPAPPRSTSFIWPCSAGTLGPAELRALSRATHGRPHCTPYLLWGPSEGFTPWHASRTAFALSR